MPGINMKFVLTNG